MQYLDDSQCVKRFPVIEAINDDPSYKEFTCQVTESDDIPSLESGFKHYDDFKSIEVDVETLGAIVTDPDVNLCIILTRRVSQAKNSSASLYHKYLCAGERSASVAYETWSR